MAERIVIMGASRDALELWDSLDGDILVKKKICRVSLAKWSGPLANATVLFPHKKFLHKSWENSTAEEVTAALDRIQRTCPRSTRFELPLWIPFASHESLQRRSA